MTTWTARRLAWSVGIVSDRPVRSPSLALLFIDRGSDLPDNVATWSASDDVDVLVSLSGVRILGDRHRAGAALATRMAGVGSSRRVWPSGLGVFRSDALRAPCARR